LVDPGNEPGLFEPAEALRENVGRNPLRSSQEIGIAGRADHHGSQQQQRPLVADDVERRGDGTSGAELHHSPHYGFVLAKCKLDVHGWTRSARRNSMLPVTSMVAALAATALIALSVSVSLRR